MYSSSRVSLAERDSGCLCLPPRKRPGWRDMSMVLDGLPRAEAVAGGRLALAGPTTAAAGFVRRRRGPGQYKPCPALAETRLVSSTPTAERPAARSRASTGR